MPKRVIDTTFWTDDKVVDLFTPEDRYFYLYLMTNPHTTQLGIYHVNKRFMAFETGYNLETINALLERFEKQYDLIKYSETTSEVAIKNYLKHSIVKGGDPVKKLLEREIVKVKDKSLFKYIVGGLEACDTLNSTVAEILPIINNVNVNGNVNVNAVSHDDSETVHTTVQSSVQSSVHNKKKFTPPELQEVKAYCIERGNNVDAEKFIDFYESKGWMVGKNKMKDWRAAVRTWEKGDSSKKSELQQAYENLERKLQNE